MVDEISRKTYEKNGAGTIADSDGILWSNEKHVAEGLGYKNLRVTTVKYFPGHRKRRYELEDEPKKPQPDRKILNPNLLKNFKQKIKRKKLQRTN